MAKYIKNNTQDIKVWLGQTVAVDEYYLIPSDKEIYWANDVDVLVDIANLEAIVAKTDDSTTDILDINDAINYLKDNIPKTVESLNQPFFSKKLSTGQKVFKRLHGISSSVSGAPDNIDFVIPYDVCKITGIEIINTELGDKVNFKVYDTPTGTISGTPNALLNQFAFNLNTKSGSHREESSYDADLIKDMKIRIEFDAITPDLLPKTIYVNFLLHEVV